MSNLEKLANAERTIAEQPRDTRRTPAAPVPASTGRVPIPTNADQAAGMVLVGMAWLKEHAPERLVQPVAARELDVEAEFRKWKGYELPALNNHGQFHQDWLHREFVAFKAGIDRAARRAAQSTAPVSTEQAGDAALHQPSPLYFQALELVRDAERASVSMVQRRLRIGWGTARNLIELMLLRSEIPDAWAPILAGMLRAPSPNNSPVGGKD